MAVGLDRAMLRACSVVALLVFYCVTACGVGPYVKMAH
jgi:hypothetical protein